MRKRSLLPQEGLWSLGRPFHLPCSSVTMATKTVRHAVFWAVATPVARYGLAGVWAYAAVTKLGDPDAAVRAVRAYQLVPAALVEPLAWGLPFVELTLALLLVTGVASRAAAWASLVLLAVFVAGIASVWARGLRIECGCFGEGGSADVDGVDYALEILRDLGFAALAIAVAVGPSDSLRLRAHLPVRLRTRAGQSVLLAVALVIAVALGVVVQGRRSELGSSDVVPPAAIDEALEVRGTPWTIGRADAPVTVEIYEDFLCAHCREFHKEVEPALAPLVEDGTARVAYHPMPLSGEDSVRVATAVACAYDEGGFVRYRDAVYADQRADGPVTDQRLISLGKATGLTGQDFEHCIRDGTHEGWIRDRLDAGSRRGVVLTPTVFIQGELAVRVTAASLAAAVREER